MKHVMIGILAALALGVSQATPPESHCDHGSPSAAVKCNVCNGTGWQGQFKCAACGGDGVFGN